MGDAGKSRGVVVLAEVACINDCGRSYGEPPGKVPAFNYIGSGAEREMKIGRRDSTHHWNGRASGGVYSRGVGRRDASS